MPFFSVFTVVAPYDIRQGKSYNIYVRGFSLKNSVRLVIRINGTADSGEFVNIKKTATLSSSSSKASIKIDVSKIFKILKIATSKLSSKSQIFPNYRHHQSQEEITLFM